MTEETDLNLKSVPVPASHHDEGCALPAGNTWHIEGDKTYGRADSHRSAELGTASCHCIMSHIPENAAQEMDNYPHEDFMGGRKKKCLNSLLLFCVCVISNTIMHIFIRS